MAQLCLFSDISSENVKQHYSPKNYDYLISNLPGFSDDCLRMHFKLYQTYVESTNGLLKKLKELNDLGKNATIEFAKCKHLLNAEFDKMLLHEYYFENLQAHGPSLLPSNPFYEVIVKDFGSYEAWKDDFVSCGLIRGMGWVITYIEPKNGKLLNGWVSENDLDLLNKANPLLVMDVFEHAYITQFGMERNTYIEAFLNNVDWNKVAERLKESR